MPKQNNVEVVCVTDKDCPRNQEFDNLLSMVDNGRRIDFYTQNMEDLSLIAKHRILPVPTFIVLCNGRAVGRIVHPPDTEHMTDLLQTIESIYR